jgi:alpha-tubulin suppressor-like RCC1 family protein
MKTLHALFLSFAFSLPCQSLFAGQPPGQVVGWGDTGMFQTKGAYEYRISTNAVTIASETLNDAKAIAVGNFHYLALKSNGTIFGWGWNHGNQAIGSQTPDDYHTNGLVMIGGQVLSNIMSVAAGSDFSLGLKRDGTVVAWGKQPQAKAVSSLPVVHDNEQTKLLKKKDADVIDPETGWPVDKNAPSKPLYTMQPARDTLGNSFTIELKSDGTVLTRVENQQPAPLSNVVAIAAHEFTALALKRDGTVVGWNSESSVPTCGQLYMIEGLSNIVAISIGGGANIAWNTALKKDGRVVVWGSGIPYEKPVPEEATNVVAIAAGTAYSLALKKDGTVFGFGYNRDGAATGVPTDQDFSSGLVTTGGQILSNVVAISAGGRYSLALKKDGTVVAWGDHRGYNNLPVGLSNVVAIAAGEGYCLAITTNSSTTIKR